MTTGRALIVTRQTADLVPFQFDFEVLTDWRTILFQRRLEVDRLLLRHIHSMAGSPEKCAGGLTIRSGHRCIQNRFKQVHIVTGAVEPERCRNSKMVTFRASHLGHISLAIFVSCVCA